MGRADVFISYKSEEEPAARRIREVLELVGMGIKNFSSVPWQFIPVLKQRFPELEEYREASKHKGAFLDPTA